MPDLKEDTVVATAYPPVELYKEWQQEAESYGQSTSQFIVQMVETGRKNLKLESVANDSLEDLRRRNENLRTELNQARERLDRLDRQLTKTEHAALVEFVKENPGATMPEIVQYLADTIPGRVAGHLDFLEGNQLRRSDSGYYPKPDTAQNKSSGSTQPADDTPQGPTEIE